MGLDAEQRGIAIEYVKSRLDAIAHDLPSDEFIVRELTKEDCEYYSFADYENLQSPFRILVIGGGNGTHENWESDDILIPIAKELRQQLRGAPGFDGFVLEVENWAIRDPERCLASGVKYGPWLDPDER